MRCALRGDTRTRTLPPAHIPPAHATAQPQPLLQRVQARLKEQLTKELARVTDEVQALTAQRTAVGREREDLGVELYQFQQSVRWQCLPLISLSLSLCECFARRRDRRAFSRCLSVCVMLSSTLALVVVCHSISSIGTRTGCRSSCWRAFSCGRTPTAGQHAGACR